MVRRVLRFTFSPHRVTQPIIYQLGKQFGVTTNIRRANITKDQGWVILELEGDDQDVEKAVRWAEKEGLIVEPVEPWQLD